MVVRKQIKKHKADLSTVNQWGLGLSNLDAATMWQFKDKFRDTAANITAQAKE